MPHSPIPRRIWSYWHSEKDVPPFVYRCINNWKRMNPGYDVTLVTPTTLRKYVPDPTPPDFETLQVQRQADWTRLALLKRHGGIWLDASTILTQPLDWVHTEQRDGGFGYYLTRDTTIPEYPVIEVWFIACAPGHSFVKAWFESYHAVCSEHGNNGQAYVDSLKECYPISINSILQKISSPSYLTLNVIAQKLMQIDGLRPYRVVPADDGPFKLSFEEDWDAEKLAHRLVCQPMRSLPPRHIKLIGSQREVVEKWANSECKLRSSIYGTYLE